MNEKFKCKLCKHEWFSRTSKPTACPRCKRYDWNKSVEEVTQ